MSMPGPDFWEELISWAVAMVVLVLLCYGIYQGLGAIAEMKP